MRIPIDIPLVVPQEIKNSESDLSASLVRLPAEVLCEILSYLDGDQQVCFALSSKKLLQVCSYRRLMVPSPRAFRYLEWPHPERIVTLLDKLHPPVRNGQVQRAALCYLCLQYVPIEQNVWNVLGNMHNRLFFGERDQWTDALSSWRAMKNERCPRCYFRAKVIQSRLDLNSIGRWIRDNDNSEPPLYY